MASHWRLQNPLHSGLLLQRANEMRKVRMLCDTLITVGDQEFHAHSLVLACSSRKFQALFQGQGKHCTIDFLSGRTFQQILEFSYSEALEVSPGDLRGLLEAAEILEMETLVQECIKMLGRPSPQRHNDNEESPGSTCSDSRVEKELATKKTLKSSVIEGSAQNRGPGFESSGHTLNISENTNTSLTASNDLQGFPFYVPEMRQYPQAIGHCDSKDMIPNRLVSLQRKATPRDPETRGSPSSRNQSYPMIAGARKTSISTFGAMKPRESITITTPHLIPSVADEARSWSADVQWGSREAMVSIQSSPSLQPNPAYWRYPLSTPLLPSFSMVNTGGTVLSPVLGIPGYLDSFPQGLFDSQFIHKQTIVDLAQASRYKGQCNGASSPMNMVSPEEKKLASPIQGHQCEICEKSFMDGLCLRMHLLSHTGYQPQPCIQCEAFLSRSEGLGAKSKTPTDGEVSSTSTYSPSCSSPSSMLCLLCGKRYNAQISLKKKASLFTGACSCRCSECRRAFSSQTTLRRHLRTHKGENRYECEFCYRYFRDESTLRNHKRTHTGEKVYKCHSCSKKFSLKHQLETHLRVHTGEKPFECHLCHQRSRDYSAMIKHLRTHSGAAPYRCTICLQFCSSLSAMQKHMRGHEAEEIPADWSIEKTYLYSCNT